MQLRHLIDMFLQNDETYPLRRLLAVTSAIAIGLAAIGPAAAEYPDRPIRLIIPLAPGGAVDIIARLLQPSFEKSLGRPLVIENKAGASGIIGASTVASAEPDGYTLLLAPTTFTINPAVNARLPFDPIKGFAPIGIVARNSLLLLVNPKVPAKNLKEFAEYAKANPGKLNYATPGASSQAQLLLELFSSQAGIKMQHVPYRGGAPAVLATMTGEADVTLISPVASLQQIESGALRALATGGDRREEQLPNVPTTAEAGFPNFHATQWVGLLATAGTPKPIIDRLNSVLREALAIPEVKARFAEQGMSVIGGPASDFGTLIETEIKQWTEVAQKANIRAE